jgi:protocatechuate 3,4-dioxygenase, beta subunit
MKNKKTDRRNWLKLSLGLAAGTIGSAFEPIKNSKEECSVTTRQELGPFAVMKFRNQLDHDVDLTKIVGQEGIATGEVIVVQGKVLDTECNPIEGAIVEIWQANHHGKYRHEFGDEGKSDPNFQGWGQAITNGKGEYRFKTIVPGLYGRRARHIHYKIAKRGYHELVTQLYFEGYERNDTDGILNSFTHEEQLRVVKKLKREESIPSIEFNINLDQVKQGTVPEKVLAEYVGRYDLNFKGTYYEYILTNFLGGPHEKAEINIVHENGLMYLTTKVAPKAELFWKAKDTFDSSAFYDSELFFERNNTGKINSITFKWKLGKEMKGIKI